MDDRDHARSMFKSDRTPYNFITKTCPYCKWPFQCSTEQMDRLACRACETLR